MTIERHRIPLHCYSDRSYLDMRKSKLYVEPTPDDLQDIHEHVRNVVLAGLNLILKDKTAEEVYSLNSIEIHVEHVERDMWSATTLVQKPGGPTYDV